MSDPLRRRLVDHDLSRRLERAEGRSAADCVETRARLSPAVGATWRSVAGAFALFDGPSSPVTQTFALGMDGPVTDAVMEELEAFFRERHAPVFHEVSPIADDTALQQLTTRGYRPIEFTNVLFREISPGITLDRVPNVHLSTHRVGPADADTWIETSVHGWSEFPQYAGEMRELGRMSVARAEGAPLFLATLHGRAIATGSLSLFGGVALLCGASTIPDARQQGAQLALLEARLRHGADAGCDIAMMCARPGSGSQRNAERHGFRIAYTRIKWELPADRK